MSSLHNFISYPGLVKLSRVKSITKSLYDAGALFIKFSLSLIQSAVGSKASTHDSTGGTGATPEADRIHPLSEAWNIDPAELAVCQLPDGKDWLLGAGSFGEGLSNS